MIAARPTLSAMLAAMLLAGCAAGSPPPAQPTPEPASGPTDAAAEPEPPPLSLDERRAAPFRTVSTGEVAPARTAGVVRSAGGASASAGTAAADPADEPDASSSIRREPAVPRQPAPDGSMRTHRVEWGQTWYGIARLYSVSREALGRANPGVEPELLRAGDLLRIPPRADDGGRTHTVGIGDTLWNISRRYDVALEAIRAANGIEGSSIRIGQVLIIPGR